MKKYLTVFTVSWQNGFVYRINFIFWRVRSVILVITVYFLWEAIFRNGGVIFGYNRERILTYVFLTLVIRSLVLGLRSIDTAGEIADGRLSNYLIKPINYHLYWFVRDLADKLLNIVFSVLEIVILYLVLRPPIFIQQNISFLLSFAIFLIIAVFINYLLAAITSNFAFWTPENAWGFWFVLQILQDFLGGIMYPLDIFPQKIYEFLKLLPFPYLLYFPVNIYLGKIEGPEILKGLLISCFWLIVLALILRREWSLGLRSYQAEGR